VSSFIHEIKRSHLGKWMLTNNDRMHGQPDEQPENTMLFACFVNGVTKNNKPINIRPKSVTIKDS